VTEPKEGNMLHNRQIHDKRKSKYRITRGI